MANGLTWKPVFVNEFDMWHAALQSAMDYQTEEEGIFLCITNPLKYISDLEHLVLN